MCASAQEGSDCNSGAHHPHAGKSTWGQRRSGARRGARPIFGFSLCSHQFSTWTHPSSPQVSRDLENMFPCLSAVSGFTNFGEFCLGAALFRVGPPEWPKMQKALPSSWTFLCTGLERGESVVAVTFKDRRVVPALCSFLCWGGTLRSADDCLPRKGWFSHLFSASACC